ncbi:dihydrofolate reductase-like domain-containing protein [Mycena haematopus]|nr:dihydrofolate reductase-like domain-containing protein [Mycena haematopus]
MSRLTIIVAATKSNGIGRNSHLPWRLAKEMAYFARVTSNAPEGASNAVIMGRNTWESIPTKFRPLKNRVNIVVSRNASYDASSDRFSGSARLEGSLEAAITRQKTEPVARGFIIGGASLYAESLAMPPSSQVGFVDRILLTRILSPAFEECDVFMPEFLDGTNADDGWKRAAHDALEAWVGFEVAEGVQEEHGVKYEFQMWIRQS